MNATSFFSEREFEQLKEMSEREEQFDVFDTPFNKKIKENGNTYEILITSGRYRFREANRYFISGIYNFNHKGRKSTDRQLYGGTFSINSEDMTGFDSFISRINRLLERTPDYIKDEQPMQYTLF